MSELEDDQIVRAVERRLADVERFIPDAPPWRPAPADLVGMTVRVGGGSAFGPTVHRRPAWVWAMILIILTAALVGASVIVGSLLRQMFTYMPARNGVIAYVSVDDTGVQALVTMAADGSRVRTIVPATSDGSAACPAFSPDGTALAYLGGDGSIVVVTAEGSSPRVFGGGHPSAGTATGGVHWSPDGTRLAYLPLDGSFSGESIEIRSIRDGSTVRVLIHDADHVQAVAWAPDGRRLVVLARGGNTTQERNQGALFVVDASGTTVQRIVTFETPFGSVGPAADAIAWSPDGSYIAYSRPAGVGGAATTNDIFVVRPDGTGERDVSVSLVEADGPVWSPDSQRLAFIASTTGGTGAVVSVGIDGSDPRTTTLSDAPRALFWSPDGARLLVTFGYAPSYPAVVPMVSVPADGVGPTTRFATDGGSCGPTWQRLPPAP